MIRKRPLRNRSPRRNRSLPKAGANASQRAGGTFRVAITIGPINRITIPSPTEYGRVLPRRRLFAINRPRTLRAQQLHIVAGFVAQTDRVGVVVIITRAWLVTRTNVKRLDFSIESVPPPNAISH